MDWLPDGRLVISHLGRQRPVRHVAGRRGLDPEQHRRHDRPARHDQADRQRPQGADGPQGRRRHRLRVGEAAADRAGRHQRRRGGRPVPAPSRPGRTAATSTSSRSACSTRTGSSTSTCRSSINYGGATTNPQPARQPRHHHQGQPEHRCGARTSPAACAPRTASAGARRTASSSPTTRAAGCPSSKLLHIKQDRFFNHYMNPAGPFDSAPGDPAGAVDAAERDRQLAEHPAVHAHRPVRRPVPHRRRHVRRPAARPTWRRSTASTRARCSG